MTTATVSAPLAGTEGAKSLPNLSGVAKMLKVSAWMGLIAAAAIWYLMARDLYRITGIFGMSPPPYQAR
jgi:hypothetical protein